MAAGIRRVFTTRGGMPGAGAQALKKRKKKTEEEKQAFSRGCLIGCF
jgi:hypothetical protein